jgi:GAF domain/AMIN domain
MKSGQFPPPAEELKQDPDAISAVIQTQHTVAVSNFDLHGKLVYIIEQGRKITNAGGAVIGLRQGDEIVCLARAGFLGPPVGACLDPHSGISGECIRTGELLYCDDTETDSRVNLSACRQLGIRSIVAFPLIQHETCGVVEIFSAWAGVFGDRERRTLKMLAGQIIEALWEEETPIVIGIAGTASARAEAQQPRAVTGPASAPFTASAASAVAPSETTIGQPAVAAESASQVQFEFPSETNPRLFTPKIIIGLVLVLTLLSVLVWQYWGPRPLSPFSESDTSRVQVGDAEPQPTVTPVPSGQAHLTRIVHWSKRDYTSIAVFLDGAARYQATTLHDPERIRFDLQDTSIAAGLLGKKPKKEEMVWYVNDGLVARIHAAQEGNVTRVVLDLKAPADYNAVLSAAFPYRLMIAVHLRGTIRP